MHNVSRVEDFPNPTGGPRLFVHEAEPGKPRLALQHKEGDIEYIEVSERAIEAIRGVPVSL